MWQRKRFSWYFRYEYWADLSGLGVKIFARETRAEKA